MKLDRKIKLMRLIDILEQKAKLSMIDFWLPFKVHNHEHKEKQSYHTEKKKKSKKSKRTAKSIFQNAFMVLL